MGIGTGFWLWTRLACYHKLFIMSGLETGWDSIIRIWWFWFQIKHTFFISRGVLKTYFGIILKTRFVRLLCCFLWFRFWSLFYRMLLDLCSLCLNLAYLGIITILTLLRLESKARLGRLSARSVWPHWKTILKRLRRYVWVHNRNSNRLRMMIKRINRFQKMWKRRL